MIENVRQLMIFLRCLGLIMANKGGYPSEVKKHLLLDYLLFKFKFSKFFLGHKLHFFDHQTTASLIESIFIDNEYYFKSKSSKPIIYDLGSNIGLSVIYFKTLYPKSIVHAFDPDPLTFATLQKNISSFCFKNVHLHNLAITNQTGQISFYLDPVSSGSPLMSTDPIRLKGKKISVPSTKLSVLVKTKIDFIKMDVEGSETSILQDLDRSKKLKLISQMSVEYHHHINQQTNDFSSFLRHLENNNFGYQIHASQNTPFKLKSFEDIKILAYQN